MTIIRMKLMLSSLGVSICCALPLVSHAHSSSSSDGTSFTPASPGEPFKAVLHECVNRVDTDARLFSGLGDVLYPLVAMGPDAAQVEAFYSQGMILQYGFNFPEAIHAFYKAASLDPGAAMPYWGIALSANSNINSNATQGCNRLAYRAAQIALENASKRLQDIAAKEKYTEQQLRRELDYAKAFGELYDKRGAQIVVNDDTKHRYADAMEALSETYFDDLDAAALYADALLNITPWKWWHGDISTSDVVKPTPEAEKALQVLNKVLIQDSKHAGANHFFIHAIEESPYTDSGLPMANRFRDLVPASGHLVHMASHIYQRVGDNALASVANYTAVSVDRAYAHQVKPRDVYPLHYLGHNIHFLTWTLSIEGRKNETVNMADELVENTTEYAAIPYLCTHFPEEVTIKSDYFYAVPYYYAVRFQDWDFLERIEPKIDQGIRTINDVCQKATQGTGRKWTPLTKPYTDAMLSYAKAYKTLATKKLDTNGAIAALSGYWSTVKAKLEAAPNLTYGNNKAVELFRIANMILVNQAQDSTAGQLSIDEVKQAIKAQLGTGPAQALNEDVQSIGGSHDQQVIVAWQKGVEIQDSLNYNEPPDWYYTLRESLGYAHLSQGHYEEAEKIFLQDLMNNRLSGRSLFGLKTSLERQKGKEVPALLENEFRNAWRNATVSPDAY